MNLKKIKIGIIQYDIIWHNPNKNQDIISKIIKSKTKVDLWILPEMFSTGFTMEPEKIAETMKGITIKWMKNISKKINSSIMGSIVIKEKNKFYNRLIFVNPKGNIKFYDKHQLFTYAGENKHYTRGNKKLIIEFKGWKIRPLICYDLRFPVWSRNTDEYDLLIYVAQWPKNRISAWNTLLKARSIENICYCICVNRIGIDKNKLEYIGNSSIYDPLGKRILFLSDKKKFQIIELDKEKLISVRKRFPFLNDRDSFIFN